MTIQESNPENKNIQKRKVFEIIGGILYSIFLLWLFFLLIELGAIVIIAILVTFFIGLCIFSSVFINAARSKKKYAEHLERKIANDEYKVLTKIEKIKLAKPTKKKVVKPINLELNLSRRKPLIKKCDNCGMILPGFVKKCPVCKKIIQDN